MLEHLQRAPHEYVGVRSEKETEKEKSTETYSDRDANPRLIALTVPVRKRLRSIEGERMGKASHPLIARTALKQYLVVITQSSPYLQNASLQGLDGPQKQT